MTTEIWALRAFEWVRQGYTSLPATPAYLFPSETLYPSLTLYPSGPEEP
jgi:hypothetical protein